MNSVDLLAPTKTLSEDLYSRCQRGRVVVIDDDTDILDAFRALIELEGFACETYASARAYLQVLDFNQPLHPGPSCVLCDVKMPDMDGLELQKNLRARGDVPLVLMSGGSGAPEAVAAFRAGAFDFLIKPIDADHLLGVLNRALDLSTQRQQQAQRRDEVEALLGQLSEREHQVALRVARGVTNLGISLELGISLRTVKFHRQRVLEKLGIAGTPELVRLLQERER